MKRALLAAVSVLSVSCTIGNETPGLESVVLNVAPEDLSSGVEQNPPILVIGFQETYYEPGEDLVAAIIDSTFLEAPSGERLTLEANTATLLPPGEEGGAYYPEIQFTPTQALGSGWYSFVFDSEAVRSRFPEISATGGGAFEPEPGLVGARFSIGSQPVVRRVIFCPESEGVGRIQVEFSEPVQASGSSGTAFTFEDNQGVALQQCPSTPVIGGGERYWFWECNQTIPSEIRVSLMQGAVIAIAPPQSSVTAWGGGQFNETLRFSALPAFGNAKCVVFVPR